MGLNYECVPSILLCAEDNESILGLDDDNEESEQRPSCRLSKPKNCDFYADLLMDFPLQSFESISLLVDREYEHLPRADYADRLRSGALDLTIRRDAIDWIWKVHAQYNFGPLSAYLSVNYLDRFLSVYELPQGKAWATQLLSVACLTLAAKMEEIEVPLSMDLQVGEAKYVFEARTIQRMELSVLSTLKWRMHAVTPFSFIDFFLYKFNGGNSPTRLSVSRSVELILSTISGIDFIAFRPSEIAVAIALSVLGETQIVDIEKAASCCNQVGKEAVLKCYEAVQDLILMRSRTINNACPSAFSVPQSPIGVLEAACLSNGSDDFTVESHATCHHSSPASKRRKISRLSMS